MVADIVIAIGLTIEKKAHMSAQALGKANGVGTPMFYVGIILKNIVGEIGNLLAYGLAPASVVAPVGTVGVMANAFLAVRFLGEPCRRRDGAALVLVVVGIVLIVLAVPENQELLSVHMLLSPDFYFAPRAYVYLICLVPCIGFFTLVLEPRFATRYMEVWLFLCGLISSVTVAAARGFASLVTQVIPDCSAGSCQHGVQHPPCAQTIGHWLFWGLVVILVLTGVWSEYYRVLATNHFDNTQVVPVYQCFFTLTSILGGMLVYNEFATVTVDQAIMFVVGCGLALSGILLLRGGTRGAPGGGAAANEPGGGDPREKKSGGASPRRRTAARGERGCG